MWKLAKWNLSNNIFFVFFTFSSKQNYKKSVQQYNEFDTVIIQTE